MKQNHQNETAKMSKTKTKITKTRKALKLLRANHKQANLGDIQANRSAI